MIKKYYLCDIFTGLEILLALALFIKAITQHFSDSALWIFVAAELCDAADGPCARKWPYPARFDKCFRRVHVKEIEHISDIFLLCSCMLYLIRYGGIIGSIALAGGTAIILFSILIELFIRYFHRHYTNPEIDGLIMVRRYFYLGGIAVGVALLIFTTSYHILVKITMCVIGVAVGIALWIAKPDRAKHP